MRSALLKAKDFDVHHFAAAVDVERERAQRRASLALTDVVSQTRPPATTGDDHPRPGTGVFHTHVLRFAPRERQAALGRVSLAVGPRNCGQSSAPDRRRQTTRAEQRERCGGPRQRLLYARREGSVALRASFVVRVRGSSFVVRGSSCSEHDRSAKPSERERRISGFCSSPSGVTSSGCLHVRHQGVAETERVPPCRAPLCRPAARLRA